MGAWTGLGGVATGCAAVAAEQATASKTKHDKQQTSTKGNVLMDLPPDFFWKRKITSSNNNNPLPTQK